MKRTISRNTPAAHSPSRRLWLASAASTIVLAACGGGGSAGEDNLTADGAEEARFRAEYEDQAATMLASPTTDYKAGWSMVDVQARMIRALVGTQPVVHLLNSDMTDNPADNDAKRLIDALARLGVPESAVQQAVRFIKVPHADLWVRDYGGLFVSSAGNVSTVLDFDFDGYRFSRYSGPATRAVYDHDDDLSVRVAKALRLPVERSPLITEGGNLVMNGHGTLISVKSSLEQSNPDWTLPEIEAELHRALHLKNIIWLPRGLASDAHPVLQTPYTFKDSRGGERRVYNIGVNHADEMVHWVNDHTVMLPEVTEQEVAEANLAGDPTAAINRTVLQECYGILKGACNASGQPLNVIRVPEPGAIEVELTPGDVAYQFLADLNADPANPLIGIEDFQQGRPVRMLLAASYMNLVVTPSVVLVPLLHKTGRSEQLRLKDQRFLEIVTSSYPGRRVVGIDVDALTVGGGGMHCITQQLPLGVNLG